MSDRHNHWEQVYQTKRNDEVGWYQANPALSLQLIQSVAPDKNAAIIDVGGGASLLVDALLEKGYSQLAVLDISESAVKSVQKRLGERAEQVEWFVTDVTEFHAPHRFSLWHDRAVFHFLIDKADQQKYVTLLCDSLTEGAHVVLATFAEDGPEKCSGLPVERYSVEKITATLGERFELRQHRQETHLTPSSFEQRFNYFLFTYRG